MRPTCTYCARKHLAQALVLLQEAQQGYPEHVWFAIGHLAEASDELVQDFPDMANEIRLNRKNLEQQIDRGHYSIDIPDLITKVGKLMKVTVSPEVAAKFDAIADEGRVAAVRAFDEAASGPQDCIKTTLVDVPYVRDANAIRFQVWPDPIDFAAGVVFTSQVPVAVPLNDQISLFISPTFATAVRATRNGIPTGFPTGPGPFNPSHSRNMDEGTLDQAGEARLVRDRSRLRAIGACLQARGAFGPATAPPKGAPAPAAPGGCSGCTQNSERNAWANADGIKRRIAIITALGDFSPAYSLVSVICDQARAASLLPGVEVKLFVRENCDLTLCPTFPANVQVCRHVPAVGFSDDVSKPEVVEKLTKWLDTTAQALGRKVVGWVPVSFITHDLLFQAAFLPFAQALHQMIPQQDVKWHHVAHSSVGSRPADPKVQARCTLPDGHKLLAVNHADVPHLKNYYQTDQIVTVLNPRDIRAWSGMPPAAAELVSRFQLHLVDVLMVYPLSATRMQAKGLTRVIELFAAMHQIGVTSVRLVVADAHCNGTPGQQERTLMRRYAQSVKLPDECLIFVSEAIPDLAGPGLDQPSVRSLLQIADVFVFPTTSEAGSLVLMEAAMAGNLLVLNGSLPCLADYIPADAAIWVPWGSIKARGETVDNAALAERVLDDLERGFRRTRKHVVRLASLERYASELGGVLGLPAAAAE
jgi:hypothetical protein